MDHFDKIITERLRLLKIRAHNPANILYKYVDIETAKKILTNSNLLYQIPNNFNDPFDLHMGLMEFIPDYDDTFFNEILEEFPGRDSNLLRKTLTKKIILDSAFEKFEGDKQSLGILCLSRTNVSTLMWSHYSAKHTGICLGFKIPSMDETNTTTAFNVNYADKVIPRKFYAATSPKNKERAMDNVTALICWTCTKSKHWAYEKEVRVIQLERNGLLPFDKDQLTEIYFGVSTPQREIDKIKNIVKTQGYKPSRIGKMEVSKGRFNLEIDFAKK